MGDAGLESFTGGGEPTPNQTSLLVGALLDLSTVTQNNWLDVGSAYVGQGNFYLSELAAAEIDRGEVGGVGAKDTPLPLPPPRPKGGNLWRNFANPPNNPHSQPRGGGTPFRKFRPTWVALGTGVGRTQRQATPPPPHPRPLHTLGGNPWKNFYRDPGTPTFLGWNPHKIFAVSPLP